jgi:hypothetical protein
MLTTSPERAEETLGTLERRQLATAHYRATLSRSPHAEWLLPLLTRDPHPLVRASAAHHPRCTPADLTRLHRDESVEVRIAVAQHQSLPLEALMTLAEDPDQIVRLATLANPSAPAWHLERGAQRHPDTVASNPSAPPALLRSLADSQRPSTLKALAANTAIPTDLLERLTRAYNPDARNCAATVAAKHPHLTREQAERLARHHDPRVRAALGESATLPATVIDHLTRDEEASVRAAAARHAPPRTLRALAHDTDPTVRAAAASHATTHELERLARDPHANVRLTAATNPHLPNDLLELLARDTHQSVRYAIAKHHRTTPTTLRLLALDPMYFVRDNVAKNPNTSPDTLADLANDPSHVVLITVALNPRTPCRERNAIRAIHALRNDLARYLEP